MPFVTTVKKMKYLGIHYPTKHIQDVCAVNYKMLMKKSKKTYIKKTHTMFMDWKTQHNKNVNSPQIDL